MPDLEPTTPASSVPPQPASNGAAGKPKPKGLLPVPPEVEQRVDAYIKSFEGQCEFSAEDRERIIHDYTLSWHYGGDVVVMRRTPKGYEVLASGDDVWEFLRNTPPGQKQGIVVHNPAVWDGIQVPWFIGEVR